MENLFSLYFYILGMFAKVGVRNFRVVGFVFSIAVSGSCGFGFGEWLDIRICILLPCLFYFMPYYNCIISHEAIIMKLKDLSSTKSGYPFRGSIEEELEGEVAVVQIKNVDTETGIDWKNLTRTHLTGRRKPDLLRRGDILFIAQGIRNIAVCVDETDVDTVCSPHFFLIRLKPWVRLLPEFLAWQINQVPAQRYLSASATGSYITGIRRWELENLPVSVPDIEMQKKVVTFYKAAVREKKLLLDMIENRRLQMHTLAKTVLTEQTEDQENE